jgi:hypothetical protein
LAASGIEEGYGLKWALGLVGSILLLGPVKAEERCPVEVKLLLATPTAQPVIASLGFREEAASLIYFFDTPSLDLLMQGVIVRVRQGANNDLTLKVRPPKAKLRVDSPELLEQFPCEIDRTRAAADTSYAVGRRYKTAKVPEIGRDIYRLFSASQKKLLSETRVSIDWARVIRIVSINSTKWKTGARSPYGKLALELWEWPAGKILELSAKAPPAADVSKYAELERLLRMKDLSLNASQDTKTNIVLQTLANHPSPL